MSLALVFHENTPYLTRLPNYDGLIRVAELGENAIDEFPLCVNSKGEDISVCFVKELDPAWIKLKDSKNKTFDAFYAWNVWKAKFKLLSFAEASGSQPMRDLIYKLVGLQEPIWRGVE